MAIHVDYILDITSIPRECIEDCSAPGPADDAVRHWRERLAFTVDKARALTCIKGYGAWDDEERAAMSDDNVAEIVLWLACGDFREYITHAEAAGFDPFASERPDGFDPNSGSDIFCLE